VIELNNHSFIIKGVYYGKTHTFPDLNDYIQSCSRHPQVGAKMKRDYMIIASNAIRKQLGRLKIVNPVKIHYFFYEGDVRRDFSNVGSFATKVIEDALQKCGVLKNDNQVWVKGYTHDFYVDKQNPRIEVIIEELE
jgi:Holliday junction resolvase RusA-like endonuclease